MGSSRTSLCVMSRALEHAAAGGSSCPALVAGLPLAVQSLAQTTGQHVPVMGSSQGILRPLLVRDPGVAGLHIFSQRHSVGSTIAPRQSPYLREKSPKEGSDWPSQ